jgi:inorganic pyrophosphatase
MPTHKHPDTGYYGDNDPLDACEIGTAVGVRGQIKQVKPLGVMALIDEGELVPLPLLARRRVLPVA